MIPASYKSTLAEAAWVAKQGVISCHHNCTATKHSVFTCAQASCCLQIRSMAEGKKLVLLINPQWSEGQVVSDFGIFKRKQREDFVNTFVTTYSFQTKRMVGEDVRCGYSMMFLAQHAAFALAQTRAATAVTLRHVCDASQP